MPFLLCNTYYVCSWFVVFNMIVGLSVPAEQVSRVSRTNTELEPAQRKSEGGREGKVIFLITSCRSYKMINFRTIVCNPRRFFLTIFSQ